jgi:ubiquinone/menaquinone biosynthesis C-methylase UbiE
LGLDAEFIVGDARYLPFPSKSFDRVFSYSVLQHFSYTDASASVVEIGRVLKSGGESLIQMRLLGEICG